MKSLGGGAREGCDFSGLNRNQKFYFVNPHKLIKIMLLQITNNI